MKFSFICQAFLLKNLNFFDYFQQTFQYIDVRNLKLIPKPFNFEFRIADFGLR
jgi:hypothetical protein